MDIVESFKEMSAKEKTLVVGGGGLILYFLYRSVMGGGSSGVAVVDTTTAQASETAAQASQANMAVTNNQTSQIADLIQGFQQSSEDHLQTVESNNAAMLESLQASNAATIQALTSQIAAMAKVQTQPIVQSPIASSSGVSHSESTINSSYYPVEKTSKNDEKYVVPVNEKTIVEYHKEQSDNSKVAAKPGTIDYDKKRAAEKNTNEYKSSNSSSSSSGSFTSGGKTYSY